MKIVGDYNKISEELRKQIPVLKPDQIVTFQMLNGVPNPDPDQNERYKNPMLYGRVQLRTNFFIVDPYLNTTVPVGAIEEARGDEVVRFRAFIAGFGDHQFQGKFSLFGNDPVDRELYEIFWLSPEREGSMFTERGVEPKFKILDIAAENKAKASKVDLLRKALILVSNISYEDAKVLWASLNQKPYGDPSSLMTALSEYAKENYEAVLAAYDDPDMEMKANIRNAFDKSMLRYDYPTSKVFHNKEELTVVAKFEDVLTQMVSWFKNSQNGPNVYQLLVNQLAKEDKKAEANAPKEGEKPEANAPKKGADKDKLKQEPPPTGE